jgi:hypothetical protein
MNPRKPGARLADTKDHRWLTSYDIVRLKVCPDRGLIDCRVLEQKSPPRVEGRRIALLARLVVLAALTGQTTSAFAIHLARAGRLAWASAQIKMCLKLTRETRSIQHKMSRSFCAKTRTFFGATAVERRDHSCSDLEVNEYFRSAPQQLLIELSCLAVRPEAHHGPIGYQHGAVKPSVFPAV